MRRKIAIAALVLLAPALVWAPPRPSLKECLRAYWDVVPEAQVARVPRLEVSLGTALHGRWSEPRRRTPIADSEFPATTAGEPGSFLARADREMAGLSHLGTRRFGPENRTFTAQEKARYRERYAEIVAFAERASTEHTLTPEQRDRLDREVTERLFWHLSAEGVNFEMNGLHDAFSGPRGLRAKNTYFVTLSREGNHRMNRRAAQLWPSYSIELDTINGGSFRRSNGRPGDPVVGAIRVGLREMLHLDPKSDIFNHEYRHGEGQRDPNRITIIAQRGTRGLPEVEPNDYGWAQATDEKEQQTYSARRNLQSLIGDPRGPRAAERLRDLSGALLSGAEVCERDHKMMDAALAILARPPGPWHEGEYLEPVEVTQRTDDTVVTFRIFEGPLHTTSWNPRGNKDFYEMQVVVPNTREGTLTPELRRRIQEQLTLERNLATNALAQFRVLQRAYDLLDRTTDPNDRQAILNAMLGTSRIWNATNYQPITPADAERRFNRLVAFQLGRLTPPSEP